MTSRPASGARLQVDSHTRADTQPDSKFLSPYEIVSAPLKLSELRETFLNILFVSLLALFLCCSAASFPLFIFIAFCRL